MDGLSGSQLGFVIPPFLLRPGSHGIEQPTQRVSKDGRKASTSFNWELVRNTHSWVRAHTFRTKSSENGAPNWFNNLFGGFG